MKFRTIFAVLILSALTLAAVAPPKHHPEATRLLKNYDQARADAIRQYQKAVEPARLELLTKLGLLQDQLTKSGKLDDAVAVRDLADEIRRQPLTSAPPQPAAQAAPPSAIYKALTDTAWRRTGNPGFGLVLHDDFSATASHHKQTGCWAILPNGDVRLSVSEKSCTSYVLRLVDGKLINVADGKTDFIPNEK